jgi:hypothetical protein
LCHLPITYLLPANRMAGLAQQLLNQTRPLCACFGHELMLATNVPYRDKEL